MKLYTTQHVVKEFISALYLVQWNHKPHHRKHPKTPKIAKMPKNGQKWPKSRFWPKIRKIGLFCNFFLGGSRPSCVFGTKTVSGCTREWSIGGDFGGFLGPPQNGHFWGLSQKWPFWPKSPILAKSAASCAPKTVSGKT